jgi:ketosteroid isomerase-like protein
MANTTSTRRSFLLTTIAAATATPTLIAEGFQTDEAEAVKTFLRKWDEAWAKHDAMAIAGLHRDDAVTVNRFGTVVRGRADLEKALGFLHGAGGPFHNSVFPPLGLLIQRMVAPGVQVVQAKWQNPVMKPDGKIDPASFNDMIVTFVLLKGASGWLASEVNLVNVEEMDLPFSNPGQKPA